jgi:hypothetical protein
MTLQEQNAEVVAVGKSGREYQRGELSIAFDRLADERNWKNPLRAWVPYADLELYRTAAQFFAGSPLDVQRYDRAQNHVLVTGPGYYSCIGA